MFEYFTDSAIQILISSEDLVRELQHEMVCPEHILLAIIKSKNKVEEFLLSEELNCEILKDSLLDYFPTRTNKLNNEINFSADAKLVLDHAFVQLKKQKLKQIGPSELLFALFDSSENSINNFFKYLKKDNAILKANLIAALSENETEEASIQEFLQKNNINTSSNNKTSLETFTQTKDDSKTASNKQPAILDFIAILDKQATKVITLAQQEARRAGYTEVGVGQLMLGLCSANGQASKLLSNLGITSREFRQCLEKHLGKGRHIRLGAEIKFSDEAQIILLQTLELIKSCSKTNKEINDIDILKSLASQKFDLLESIFIDLKCSYTLLEAEIKKFE